MITFRMVVKESFYTEYAVEAESEVKARFLVRKGHGRVVNDGFTDWDIIAIEQDNPRLDPDDIAEIQSAMQENADDSKPRI
jgi:hypothetical protein|tara:strand:- start:255 stop:497 length:243 start_codon:yes stop_codon:yes gene_type:complete